MENKYQELATLIKKAKKIVFFGGAGVSTESGIPDFRSDNGLYNLKSKYDAPYEVMLSHSYYENHKDNFFGFYKDLIIPKNIKPNDAHKFLASLEKKKDISIITQNIDGLHQEAGSKNVIELHGSIKRNYCESCARYYTLKEMLKLGDVPKCPKCGGYIKPDVVLYEEPLDQNILTKALITLQNADLLIVAGTSLNVYPAAGLISYFYGNNIVIINLEKLHLYREVKLEFYGQKVGEVFNEVKKYL